MWSAARIALCAMVVSRVAVVFSTTTSRLVLVFRIIEVLGNKSLCFCEKNTFSIIISKSWSESNREVISSNCGIISKWAKRTWHPECNTPLEESERWEVKVKAQVGLAGPSPPSYFARFKLGYYPGIWKRRRKRDAIPSFQLVCVFHLIRHLFR